VPGVKLDPFDFKSFSPKMSERDDDHFDIDDEFLGEAEESSDFEPIVERSERRPKAAAPSKRGKAAWSRVEDVIAERELEKELRDVFEDD
jgi:hypothetical protein